MRNSQWFLRSFSGNLSIFFFSPIILYAKIFSSEFTLWCMEVVWKGRNPQKFSSLRTTLFLKAFFEETNEKKYHSIVEPRFRGSGEVYSKDMVLHPLELPKLEKSLAQKASDVKTLEELWGKLFHANSDKDVIELVKENPMFDEAFQELKRISEEPEIVELARQREQALFDEYIAHQSTAEENRKIGRAEGEAKAIFVVMKVRGILEGLDQREFIDSYKTLPLESLIEANELAMEAKTQEEVIEFLDNKKSAQASTRSQ